MEVSAGEEPTGRATAVGIEWAGIVAPGLWKLELTRADHHPVAGPLRDDPTGSRRLRRRRDRGWLPSRRRQSATRSARSGSAASARSRAVGTSAADRLQAAENEAIEWEGRDRADRLGRPVDVDPSDERQVARPSRKGALGPVEALGVTAGTCGAEPLDDVQPEVALRIDRRLGRHLVTGPVDRRDKDHDASRQLATRRRGSILLADRPGRSAAPTSRCSGEVRPVRRSVWMPGRK